MKLGNFLFPESREPALDARVIAETIAEAKLTEQLGFDAVWLAEHHFDGICAYVDPIGFAAALATVTSRIKIGFAVAQVSLHHPIRLAEQISLLDNITKGRLIAGLGRGTAYNVYDYQGYGIPPEQAQERFEEAETIMLKAWSGEPVEHHGKFWNLKLPMLRPRPFTHPHPFIIRSSGTEESMLEIARSRRPFMMNVQSYDVTKRRMDLYRETLRAQGSTEEEVSRLVEDCWVWRNVFVGETAAGGEAAHPLRGRRHQRGDETMKRVVHTGLPEFGRPTEHAVMADGHLRTTAVPLKMDGTFETGDARSQIALALENLEKTVKAAGGEITDVIQALCFLTNADHVSVLNEEWTKRFKPPYPNRGILIVNAIGVPGIVILIQVHAYIEP